MFILYYAKTPGVIWPSKVESYMEVNAWRDW